MVVIAENWYIIRRQSVVPWFVMIVTIQLLPFDVWKMNPFLTTKIYDFMLKMPKMPKMLNAKLQKAY